ncbi:MAG: hypothetical protein JWQ62_4 [Lacunisphaera sp.]|nr:hypothetical protein [Lacunisphaera sp.]
MQETRTYTYNIQISSDNVSWRTVVPKKSSGKAAGFPGYLSDSLSAVAARYVRINGYDNSQGSGWIAIREVKLSGPRPQSHPSREGQ